jgi:hypothetical protein
MGDLPTNSVFIVFGQVSSGSKSFVAMKTDEGPLARVRSLVNLKIGLATVLLHAVLVGTLELVLGFVGFLVFFQRALVSKSFLTPFKRARQTVLFLSVVLFLVRFQV